MPSYISLGSRQVAAALDETGFNPGNLTSEFNVALLPSVAQYEIFRAVVTGVPAGASAVIQIGARQISFTAPGLGGGSEWDPSQPPIVLAGQEIYFLWNTPPAAATPATRGQKSGLLAGADGGVLTWATNPAAGQTVFVVVWHNISESVASVVDNGTSPSTFIQDVTIPANGCVCTIYRADSITLPASGSYEVTVTGSGGHTIVGGGEACSGVAAGGPAGTSTGTSPGSSAVSTGTVTPPAAGSLLIAGFGDASGVAETITLTAAGFIQQFVESNGASFFPGAFADQIVTGAPGPTACTWTLSDVVAWAAAIACYPPVSVPPGPVVTLWLRYDPALPGNPQPR